MIYLRYLKYLLRHKWFVLLECLKFCEPWVGLLHDMSKFKPSEFIPYARYFYGQGNNIKRGRDKTGYWKPGDTGDVAFDRAWLYHQHRNPHHWQYWVLTQDDGPPLVLEMPDRYMYEMIADWRGAGKAQGTPDTRAWYDAHKHKIQLHPRTREQIEALLGCPGLYAAAIRHAIDREWQQSR